MKSSFIVPLLASLIGCAACGKQHQKTSEIKKAFVENTQDDTSLSGKDVSSFLSTDTSQLNDLYDDLLFQEKVDLAYFIDTSNALRPCPPPSDKEYVTPPPEASRACPPLREETSEIPSAETSRLPVRSCRPGLPG